MIIALRKGRIPGKELDNLTAHSSDFPSFMFFCVFFWHPPHVDGYLG